MPFIKKLMTLVFIFIFSLLCLLWMFSGVVAKHQINKTLERFDLSLNDNSSLSFNPFIGELLLENLSLMQQSQVVLHVGKVRVDTNLLALFTRVISFDQIKLYDINMYVKRSDKGVEVAGIQLPTSPSESKSSEQTSSPFEQWSVDLSNLDIEKVNIKAQDYDVNHHLQINKIDVSELVANVNEQRFIFSLDSQINEAPVNAEIDGKLMSMEGDINVEFSVSEFNVKPFARYIPKPVVSLFSITSMVSTIQINHSVDKTNIDVEKLTWDIAPLIVSDAEVTVKVENTTFNGQDITAVIYASHEEQVQQPVEIDGQFEFALHDLLVIENNNEQVLVSLSQLESKPFELWFNSTGLAMITENIAVNDLSVLQILPFEGNSESISLDKAHLTDIKRIDINNLSFIQNQENSLLEIAGVNFGRINGHIILDENRQLANLPKLYRNDDEINDNNEALIANEPNIEALESAPASAPFLFSIGRIKLNDPASVYFRDNSFKELFEYHINVPVLQIDSVSSRDINSDMIYKMLVDIDQHATIDLSGAMKPFTEKLNVTFNADVDEFSLPDISAYIGKAAGVEFISGQLDTTIKVTIKEDELLGDTQLLLRGVDIKGGSAEKEGSEVGGAIPLGTAFNMLKDSDNNIELAIPLSGNVTDPKFGWGSFIEIVTKKAVMSATESYLMQTFVPYANIVSIGKLAGEYLLKVNVEPLLYLPQQTHIQPTQQAFINELTQLLNDKPESQLTLCAFSITNEIPESKNKVDQLKQIAKERGAKLKTLLVQEKGIESKRLLLCKPMVEEKGQPRIEFSL